MSVRSFGPVPLSSLNTDKGIQASMRALFPESPGLHTMTVEQMRAFAACVTPEHVWLGIAEPPRGETKAYLARRRKP